MTFEESNSNPVTYIEGEHVLEHIYNVHSHSFTPWRMIKGLWIWVVVLRLVQYTLLAWQTRTLPSLVPATVGHVGRRRKSTFVAPSIDTVSDFRTPSVTVTTSYLKKTDDYDRLPECGSGTLGPIPDADREQGDSTNNREVDV